MQSNTPPCNSMSNELFRILQAVHRNTKVLDGLASILYVLKLSAGKNPTFLPTQ